MTFLAETLQKKHLYFVKKNLDLKLISAARRSYNRRGISKEQLRLRKLPTNYNPLYFWRNLIFS